MSTLIFFIVLLFAIIYLGNTLAYYIRKSRKDNSLQNDENLDLDNKKIPFSIFTKSIISTAIIAASLFIIIVLILLYGLRGCDEGTFLINKIKVLPYDEDSQKVSYKLEKEISFLLQLDITKHKNGRRKMELIPTANATPPCNGYTDEIPLKSLEIYTNKTVYFQPYNFNHSSPEQESNYYFLQPIPPFSNLNKVVEGSVKYFSFDQPWFPDTSEIRENNVIMLYSRYGSYMNFQDFNESMNTINFKEKQIRFPKGSYKFWFKWTFWDGKVLIDSTSFYFSKNDPNIKFNYTTDTLYNYKDSVKTIIYISNDTNYLYSVKHKYYFNGSLTSKEMFLNNKLNGRAIYFYKNGKIKELVSYGYGIQLKFPYFSFYKNGNKKLFGIDDSGSSSYTYTHYKENGQIDKEESFLRSFQGNDKRVLLREYENGQLVNEYRWNEVGLKIEERNNKEQTTKRWNSDGILVENWYEFRGNEYTLCDRNINGKIVREIYYGNKIYTDTNKMKGVVPNYKVLMKKKY